MQPKLISFVPSSSKIVKTKNIEFKPFVNIKNKSEKNISVEGKRKRLWD